MAYNLRRLTEELRRGLSRASAQRGHRPRTRAYGKGRARSHPQHGGIGSLIQEVQRTIRSRPHGHR